MEFADEISRDTGLQENSVQAVLDLLDQGSSIPFIARYRKEKTGSLDEVVIADIRDRAKALNALKARKSAIVNSLKERELYTDALGGAIGRARSMVELEDLYEKYRPRKRTRAMAAREKGLDPLAQWLLNPSGPGNPDQEAKKYLGKAVPTVEEALAGARDIIAETVNEDSGVRAGIRQLFVQSSQIQTIVKKGKEEEGAKFRDYFDWSEPAFKAPSHRILAMLRGSQSGVLRLHVLPEEPAALDIIHRFYLKKNRSAPVQSQVAEAIRDAYKRLVSKSIEKESMGLLKERADEQAIDVFAGNLKELLLSAPLGEKTILALDPGFRTGCKLVCLDAGGKMVHHDVIHPHIPKGEERAGKRLIRLVKKYSIQAIAIGNGTAGRETESFVRGLDLPEQVAVIMVDESGASIYSASEIARKEFPDHDITVRGAVSIGRRLMDPLAELVKIDPKSIGVGQYQHDVDQKKLQASLDDVVINCVNQVGVEANTASAELLARVSGLNATIAANMVKFREENGPFQSRKAFLKVPRLGPKAFEQAAGFLRIQTGNNPMDRSGIHPESYGVVETIARDQGCRVEELFMDRSLVKQIDARKFVTKETGLPTVRDILEELSSPGRDPRQEFKVFSFDDTVHAIKDLVPGMRVPGIVTNVTAFGAFVDIGVHQDGLVHISQLADRFIKDPNEIVKVRQQVMVQVLEVDIPRKRISLSMKSAG